MSAHVVVHQLSKRYGPVVAVDGVSLTIERGEVFGLLGPNGAGKTTTLECLVGLREPDAGELRIGGLDVRKHPVAAKQKIGVALQAPALPARITPREALRLFGSFYPTRLAPAELLARFQLEASADAAFETLSGGQQQRLALALAFVNRPELVVLDEPTAGLDPQARHDIRVEIARLKADGHTVLLSTHELAEAAQVCDRLAIIHRGRVVATGTPAELAARSPAGQTITLVTSRPLAAEELAAATGGAAVVIGDTTVRWATADAAASLAQVATWLAAQRIGIVDLRVERPSLETVFLELTRDQPQPTAEGAP